MFDNPEDEYESQPINVTTIPSIGYVKKEFITSEMPARDIGVMTKIRAAVDQSAFGLLFDAATDNEIYSSAIHNITPEEEAGFDKWDNFARMGLTPDQVSTYDREVHSFRDAKLYEEKIRRVSQAKADLAASGMSGAALSFYSELFMSPSSIATAVMPMAFLAKGGMAIRTTKAAATGAGIGLAFAGEKTLLDPTYTKDEAISTIAASTVLMAAIGPAAKSLFGTRKVPSNQKGIDDFADKFVDDANAIYKEGGAMDLSASATPNFSSYAPVGSNLAKAATRIFAILSPSNRVANFVTQESKDFFASIAGRPTFITSAEQKGVASEYSITELRDVTQADYTRVTKRVGDKVDEYMSVLPKQNDGAVKNLVRKNQTIREAKEFIYSIVQDTSLSIDDIETLAKGNQAIPETKLWEAALEIRKHTLKEAEINESLGMEGFNRKRNYGLQMRFERWKASADQEGLFNQLKNDFQSYADQIKTKYGNKWTDSALLKQAMEQELDAFKATKTAKQLKDMEEEIAAIQKEMDDIVEFIRTEANVELKASQMLGEIIHGKTPQVTYIRGTLVSEVPGFFLERRLDPLTYQPWLDTDYETLLSIRGRQIGVRRAMKRIYGDAVGKAAREKYALSMDEKIAIQHEDEAQATIKPDNSIKEKVKRKIEKSATADELEKEKNSVLKQFDDMLATHLGEYARDFYADHPYLASGVETLKTWNAMSMLGNVVAGSVGEAAAVMIHHGIKETMPTYGKVLKKIIQDPIFRKESVKVLQQVDNAFELVNARIIGDVVAMGENIGDQSIGGFRFLENAKKYNYLLNGLTFWDFGNRMMVGLTQMTILSKNIRKAAAGKATAREIENLAKIGIGKDHYKDIVSALDNGGESIDGGLSFLHPDKMPEAIAERMRVALTNDINRVALRARTGDIPINMGHPAISLMLQFKQWSILATQKYMVPSMQRADASAMSAMATLVGFGTASYMLKEAMAGRDLSEQSLPDILYSGITQSGIAGIAPDIFLDRLANTVGIEGGGARYVNYTNLLDTIAGPSGSTLKNISKATSIMPFGDPSSENTYRAMGKLLPLQNHPVSNILFGN